MSLPVRVQVGLRPASRSELRFSSRPSVPPLLLAAALFLSSVYSASIRYFPLARAFIALVLRRSEGNLRPRGEGKWTKDSRTMLLRVPEESKSAKASASNPGPLPLFSASDPNYRSPRMDVLVMGDCRSKTRGWRDTK